MAKLSVLDVFVSPGYASGLDTHNLFKRYFPKSFPLLRIKPVVGSWKLLVVKGLEDVLDVTRC